jgi:hypothetical protein
MSDRVLRCAKHDPASCWVLDADGRRIDYETYTGTWSG